MEIKVTDFDMALDSAAKLFDMAIAVINVIRLCQSPVMPDGWAQGLAPLKAGLLQSVYQVLGVLSSVRSSHRLSASADKPTAGQGSCWFAAESCEGIGRYCIT